MHVKNLLETFVIAPANTLATYIFTLLNSSYIQNQLNGLINVL